MDELQPQLVCPTLSAAHRSPITGQAADQHGHHAVQDARPDTLCGCPPAVLIKSSFSTACQPAHAQQATQQSLHLAGRAADEDEGQAAQDAAWFFTSELATTPEHAPERSSSEGTPTLAQPEDAAGEVAQLAARHGQDPVFRSLPSQAPGAMRPWVRQRCAAAEHHAAGVRQSVHSVGGRGRPGLHSDASKACTGGMRAGQQGMLRAAVLQAASHAGALHPGCRKQAINSCLQAACCS